MDAGTTEPTAPLTVLYNTVDPSNAAPTAYYSTNGPVQERFVPADFQLDETTGDWVADKAFSIDTVAGIFDGDDVPLTVQLGNPYQCQLAGGGGGGGGGGGSSATATIVVPYIDMTAPSVKRRQRKWRYDDRNRRAADNVGSGSRCALHGRERAVGDSRQHGQELYASNSRVNVDNANQ